MPDADWKLQRLLDKDAIIDLVHKYSYCVDHRLWSNLPTLFTEDCVIDYGPGSSPVVRSRAAFQQMLGSSAGSSTFRPGFVGTSHHNANVLVAFDDDDLATVRSSLYAWHRMTVGPTATGQIWNHTTPQVWGYYHDVVRRIDNVWRFAERKLHLLGAQDWHDQYHPAEHTDPRMATAESSILDT